MFEVGWTEMLVIAVVMIVVVGPKDLPKMLRTFGRTAAKLRSMAGDFQKQFNDALKEAELEDVKDAVNSVRSLNPMNEIRKQLNPMEQAAADIRSGLDTALNPRKPVMPPAETPQPAEPLKAGPTAVPGEQANGAPIDEEPIGEQANGEAIAGPASAADSAGPAPDTAPAELAPAPAAQDFAPSNETKH